MYKPLQLSNSKSYSLHLLASGIACQEDLRKNGVGLSYRSTPKFLGPLFSAVCGSWASCFVNNEHTELMPNMSLSYYSVLHFRATDCHGSRRLSQTGFVWVVIRLGIKLLMPVYSIYDVHLTLLVCRFCLAVTRWSRST